MLFISHADVQSRQSYLELSMQGSSTAPSGSSKPQQLLALSARHPVLSPKRYRFGRARLAPGKAAPERIDGRRGGGDCGGSADQEPAAAAEEEGGEAAAEGAGRRQQLQQLKTAAGEGCGRSLARRRGRVREHGHEQGAGAARGRPGLRGVHAHPGQVLIGRAALRPDVRRGGACSQL